MQVAIDAGARHWRLQLQQNFIMYLGGCAWDSREIARGDVRGMRVGCQWFHAGCTRDPREITREMRARLFLGFHATSPYVL